MSKLINLLHIGLFAPGLLLIANYPTWNHTWVRLLLLAMSVMVFLYHGSKAIRSHHWVSWFHTLVVAPVLLTLSYQGTQIHPQVTQMTNLLGFGAIAYHSYRLYQKMN